MHIQRLARRWLILDTWSSNVAGEVNGPPIYMNIIDKLKWYRDNVGSEYIPSNSEELEEIQNLSNYEDGTVYFLRPCHLLPGFYDSDRGDITKIKILIPE